MQKDQKERDEFPYISETIVREHCRRQIRYVVRLIGSAVIFGCIAGGCMVFIQKRKPKDPPVLAVETAALAEETEEPMTDTGDGMESEAETAAQESSAAESSAAFSDAMAGYEAACASFVRVSTVYGGSGWLEDASVTGTADTFGILIAEGEDTLYFLTTADLVRSVDEIYVEIGGVSVEASAEQTEQIENIGLISVDKHDLDEDTANSLSVIRIGSAQTLKVGDTVIAAGSPYTYPGSLNYGHIVYRGVQEAYDCRQQILYTDMPYDTKGQGVLLNASGELVAWMVPGSGSSTSRMICGAAIDDLRAVIRVMISGDEAAYLGVRGQTVTEKDAEEQGVPQGLYLEQVAEDSPAKEAGLQPGDILTAVDGTALTESSTLWQQLLMHESGDSIIVTLQRLVQEKYEEMELDVELGGR